jgi:hypothetical protein
MPRDVLVQSGGAPTAPITPTLYVDLDTPQPMLAPSIPTFASTAARDAAWPTPYVGAQCITTDTGTLWQYFTTQGWYKPFSVLYSFTDTANYTVNFGATTTFITSSSITVPAGRRLRLSYMNAQAVGSSPDYSLVNLLVDGATAVDRTSLWIPTSAGGNSTGPNVWATVAPTAGAHTFGLSISRTGTTGSTTFYGSNWSHRFEVQDMGAA